MNEVTDSLEQTQKLVQQKEIAMNAKFEELTANVEQFRNKFEASQNKFEKSAEDNMSNYIPIPNDQCELDGKFPNIQDVSEEFKNDSMFAGVKGATPDNNKNFEKEWMSNLEFEKPEYFQPRMFTLNQIKDLVYLHVSRSDLKRKVSKHDKLVAYHDDEIFENSRNHKKLKTQIEEDFVKAQQNIDDANTNLTEAKKNINKRFRDVDCTLSINDKKLTFLKDHSDDAKKFHEMINSKAERLESRILAFKSSLQLSIDESSNSLIERIQQLRSHVDEESIKLDGSILKTKNL